MSQALSNVLTAGTDFALNSYIAPKYSKIQDRARAPGQPAPAFFSIWSPIFAGRIAYGFLSDEERSSAATLWNHLISATGFAYAASLVNDRYYSMQGAMAIMTAASIGYRRSLPDSTKSESLSLRAVKLTAEMGVGWLAAADMLIAAKNLRRSLGRKFTHVEQDVVGFAEVAVATAAAIGANRGAGWKGVSVAAAWALTGIAVDQRSEKHVRLAAGVATAGVLTDLALTLWRESEKGAGLRE